VSKERHSRRGFFREVVKRYVEPAAEYLDAKAPPSRLVILRPPGALPESDFLNVCEKCNACVAACPADAIRPIEVEGRLKGTPGIVASEQPCVVCVDLDCMTACPTDALVVTARNEIDLGVAVVDADQCVRSHGESCRHCVDFCPFGDRAIEIDEHGAISVLDGCIGCGVCEQACPTSPKAICIQPREFLDVTGRA
jgi:ferredoxin-type protein NapG